MTSIFLAYLYGAANGALLYYYLAYQHINRAKDTCRHYERVVQAIALQHGEDTSEYLKSKRNYELAEQELKNIAISNWNKPFKSLHRHCYERHQQHDRFSRLLMFPTGSLHCSSKQQQQQQHNQQ